jgi:hypothetical protein
MTFHWGSYIAWALPSDAFRSLVCLRTLIATFPFRERFSTPLFLIWDHVPIHIPTISPSRRKPTSHLIQISTTYLLTLLHDTTLRLFFSSYFFHFDSLFIYGSSRVGSRAFFFLSPYIRGIRFTQLRLSVKQRDLRKNLACRFPAKQHTHTSFIIILNS